MRALTTSLLRHKRIRTTEAKAKETSRYAEAIITRAKRAFLAERGGAPADIHARRVVARDIHDTTVVRELFSEIAPKVADRPGGYTRVIKLGQRFGDGARMAIIELVDYNVEQDESAVRSRSKRMLSRAERVARSRAKQAAQESKKESGAQPVAAAAAAPVVEEAPAVEETESASQPESGADAPAGATGADSGSGDTSSADGGTGDGGSAH